MALFWRKKKSEPAPVPVPAPLPVKKEIYDFIAKCDNEKSHKELEAYQKFWTEPEDKYNGMRLLEFKREGYPGDKVYKYPPLDVAIRLEAFIPDDGSNPSVKVFILTADDDIYVGTAAKTKAKKIIRICTEKAPKITGELYGGKYWKIEDSGYVDDRWEEDLTVRVYLEY